MTLPTKITINDLEDPTRGYWILREMSELPGLNWKFRRELDQLAAFVKSGGFVRNKFPSGLLLDRPNHDDNFDFVFTDTTNNPIVGIELCELTTEPRRRGEARFKANNQSINSMSMNHALASVAESDQEFEEAVAQPPIYRPKSISDPNEVAKSIGGIPWSKKCAWLREKILSSIQTKTQKLARRPKLQIEVLVLCVDALLHSHDDVIICEELSAAMSGARTTKRKFNYAAIVTYPRQSSITSRFVKEWGSVSTKQMQLI